MFNVSYESQQASGSDESCYFVAVRIGGQQRTRLRVKGFSVHELEPIVKRLGLQHYLMHLVPRCLATMMTKVCHRKQQLRH